MELSVHGVCKVRSGKVKQHQVDSTGKTFFTKQLFIQTDCGEEVRITMFSDAKNGLQIEASNKTT